MTGHIRNKSSEGRLLPPSARSGRDGRSISNAGSFNPRSGGTSYEGMPPGSFSSDIKPSTGAKSDTSRGDYFGVFTENGPERTLDNEESQHKQSIYREKIASELRIKQGSENLLEALNFKTSKQTKEQRKKVESQIDGSNRKIAQLRQDLAVEIKRFENPSPKLQGRLSQLFQGSERPSFSRDDHVYTDGSDEETESPTYILVKTLHSLEASGQPSDYYVERANDLTELFNKHPTLKYDLVWSIFGVRIQGMLLSDSREVAAAGFRTMRYAITDRRSLSTMRSFHTDYLVLLALVKEGKASVEREQALKFVRAFLDVKDGFEEISRAIVRVIVAIAEHAEDKLRNISILTLSEILIRKPSLVADAGGIGTLTDTLGDGLYQPSESLTTSFISLLDSPARRRYLRFGLELQGPFAAFTEGTAYMGEERLKINARVISNLLKSWSGLMALSMHDFIAIKTLTNSLYVNSSKNRDLVIEVVLDILRIKPPSWSAPFLAGRRLTTYGRVLNLASEPAQSSHKEKGAQHKKEGLVTHFKALLLAVFLQCDLMGSLLFTLQHEQDQIVRRKAILLAGEALDLANDVLPGAWTARLQVLPSLFGTASGLRSENRHIASGIIYQLDSVNRTLHRTGQKTHVHMADNDSISSASLRRTSDLNKDVFTPQIEEMIFKNVILETQVLNTANYSKWKWELIEKIIEGPLLNPKRLEEAMKTNKFVKRVIGFYRPFKYRFCEIRNTKAGQKYIKIGCSLMRTLLLCSEGVKYLAENKMLRQLAECLAQVDRLSGLTSGSPMFSPERLVNTLTGGYFALLGTISANTKGLAIMERWKMANMFYHIVETAGRPDLIKTLLSNLDYTLDGHLRVILSKALTATQKEIKIFSTRLLRKFAIGKAIQAESGQAQGQDRAVIEWAIDLLITQLYDPEVEVCEVAIKILEEACNDITTLEYVVQRRPALDHLGEIGAPLLLRFLSTSVGYHYLDELDYISQEMDDWFLGRNEAYVTLVEASVTHAMATAPAIVQNTPDETQDERNPGVAPPHFYRELTRTAEGCRLLESKGHFEEFVNIIRNWGSENSDPETILKVKGSLWAIGNIGAMDLGAPFLETSDVVELIVGIAERSEILSLRGTAFFVLGMISRSIHGQELLAERGWDVALDGEAFSRGICLPRDFSKLFGINPWTHTEDFPRGVETELVAGGVLHDDDPINKRILNLVNDLGNTVLAKNRAAELHRLAPWVSRPRLLRCGRADATTALK